jgi:hypothetical protein
VADPIRAVERMKPNTLFQIAKLTFRPPQLQMMLLVSDGDTRGVIPAVLEFPEAVDDQRHDLFIPYVTNNSAHKCL